MKSRISLMLITFFVASAALLNTTVLAQRPAPEPPQELLELVLGKLWLGSNPLHGARRTRLDQSLPAGDSGNRGRVARTLGEI